MEVKALPTVAAIIFSAVCAAQDSSSVELSEAQRKELATKLCRDDNRELIQSCIDPMVEALDYPDQYMREVAMKEALKDVFARNTEIKLAKERADCKKKGFELGKVRLGMSRLDVVSCGWGFPQDERRVVDKSGVTHTYFYSSRRILRFSQDKLVRIEE